MTPAPTTYCSLVLKSPSQSLQPGITAWHMLAPRGLKEPDLKALEEEAQRKTAHAFVALCGISGLLLKTVDALAKLHGRLCFMETMLPSICKTLNMSIETYDPAIAQVRWGPPVTEDEVRVLLAEGKLAIHPYKVIQTIE